MELTGDENDLSLLKASSSLLHDLQERLPRVLFKAAKNGKDNIAHSKLRQRDLDYIVKLIEPFLEDPQLLDGHLKTIVPQVTAALLQHLPREVSVIPGDCVDLLYAGSVIIYTLCRVRGRKVISGLLPNEPQHLELVIATLERESVNSGQWQTQFSLLSWLSHLLLTPFDLSSISTDNVDYTHITVRSKLPDLVARTLHICLSIIDSSALSQEVAASALCRLVARPDIQSLHLSEDLIAHFVKRLSSTILEDTIQPKLGALRFIAGIAKSTDLKQHFPTVWRVCEELMLEDNSASTTLGATGKRLLLKTVSSIVITSLRSVSDSPISRDFLDESGALETTIEFQLNCLGDRESVIRQASAKSISNLISSLHRTMADEVLDALFTTIQQEMPSTVSGSHLPTANAYLWHGITLSLSYALFRRSISRIQLPQVIRILLMALTFEQRTAAGNAVGTNVRDAANFGLWSLARRFTTAELADVDDIDQRDGSCLPVIQAVALQLLQSACLDPVGNVRRGSSAAIQELVGRHPDQVSNGIALVQVVDYVAVGLRQRAMIDVAAAAMKLDRLYWDALMEGLEGWRGLNATDIASRQHAAFSLVERLKEEPVIVQVQRISRLRAVLEQCPAKEVERQHGIVLSLAMWLEHLADHSVQLASRPKPFHHQLWNSVLDHGVFRAAYDIRAIRTELTVALVRFLTAYCKVEKINDAAPSSIPTEMIEFAGRLLTRQEDSFLSLIPSMITSIIELVGAEEITASIQLPALRHHLKTDTTRSTTHGSGRVIAVAALVTSKSDRDFIQAVVEAIQTVCTSTYVDWRIIGFRALCLFIGKLQDCSATDKTLVATLCKIIYSGLQDYYIDQRGDIGSLVRLQALSCAQQLCTGTVYQQYDSTLQIIYGEIIRLSLEKLNRVRAKAAQCRQYIPSLEDAGSWSLDVSSEDYFTDLLTPLSNPDSASWIMTCTLRGLVSCAGSGAEDLLQNSRSVLTRVLSNMELQQSYEVLHAFSEIFKASITNATDVQSSLELLAYLLQARLLQRLEATDYNWHNLLSFVRRAHYKSRDVSRLATAISAYSSLVEVSSIRPDVLKILFGLLKVIPYPRTRSAIADTLYIATRDQAMKIHDWGRAPSSNARVLAIIEARHIAPLKDV